MNKEIFLHIGLPRTGTTFLQNAVFREFEEKFIYNPKEIIQVVNHVKSACLADKADRDFLLKSRRQIEKLLARCDKVKMLISYEGIFINARGQLQIPGHILKEIFPSAKVIITMRYQPDWLISCYRHACQKHIYCRIDRFLNYRDGAFYPLPDKASYYQTRTSMDVLNLRVAEHVQDYFRAFGRKNLKIMFFENFLAEKKVFVSEICSFIGENNPVKSYSYVNRSFSPFACELMSSIYTLFGLINPRQPIDDNGKLINILKYPKFKAPLKYYLYFAVHFNERVVKKLDSFYYFKYELLKKYRLKAKLDCIFKEQNQKLLDFVPKEKVPDNYL